MTVIRNDDHFLTINMFKINKQMQSFYVVYTEEGEKYRSDISTVVGNSLPLISPHMTVKVCTAV